MRTAVALKQALAEAPWEFDFFQVMRLLEVTHPDKPRIGYSQRLADDPIRLGQDPTLAFAPSTLASFSEQGGVPRLLVYFLGLLGPNGPMPLHFTEHVRDRLRNNDPAFARFLDIFHHRALSLFYRAWADAQPAVSFDRPKDDRFAMYVGALSGLGMESLRNRDAVPDLAKLHFTGMTSARAANAEGLRNILQRFFGVDVAIRQFMPHWLDLPRETRTRLGVNPEQCGLGVSAVLGTRVWDAQHKFRITIGPIGIGDYRRFLPGSDSLAKLVAWLRHYVGDAMNWDLKLILKKEEVPVLQLGDKNRLGYSTWLGGRARTRDAEDLVLEPGIA